MLLYTFNDMLSVLLPSENDAKYPIIEIEVFLVYEIWGSHSGFLIIQVLCAVTASGGSKIFRNVGNFFVFGIPLYYLY
jgi:hypothetical protein